MTWSQRSCGIISKPETHGGRCDEAKTTHLYKAAGLERARARAKRATCTGNKHHAHMLQSLHTVAAIMSSRRLICEKKCNLSPKMRKDVLPPQQYLSAGHKFRFHYTLFSRQSSGLNEMCMTPAWLSDPLTIWKLEA